MKKIIVSLLAAIIVAPLYAVKISVKNNSTKDIQVQGYGLGCAGIVLGRALMCGTKAEVIKPGESKSITYRTTQAGTSGGIRVLSLANGALYDLKAPEKAYQKFSTDELQFPANFKEKLISVDLKDAQAKAVQKLDDIRQNKEFYWLAYAKNQDGQMVLMAEGVMPIDGKLKIGVDEKQKPMYAIYKDQAELKSVVTTDNFPGQKGAISKPETTVETLEQIRQSSGGETADDDRFGPTEPAK